MPTVINGLSLYWSKNLEIFVQTSEARSLGTYSLPCRLLMTMIIVRHSASIDVVFMTLDLKYACCRFISSSETTVTITGPSWIRQKNPYWYLNCLFLLLLLLFYLCCMNMVCSLETRLMSCVLLSSMIPSVRWLLWKLFKVHFSCSDNFFNPCSIRYFEI